MGSYDVVSLSVVCCLLHYITPWLVPKLHRAGVGSYDVVRLSGQDTTLAKDKFSSHLHPNSAAPHSNNFFCKYDLEEITLFGPNQHTALLHQQNILVQLSLGSFFAFPDGWIHFGAGNHVLSTKTNVSSRHCCPHLFFPCCPLFYSPHCCPAMCALFSRILACSLFSFYYVGLKKWNEAWT